MKKEALDMSAISSGIKRGVGIAGTLATAALIGEGVSAGLNAIGDAVRKKTAFSRMLEADPTLKTLESSQVNGIFSILWKHAPVLAEDAHTAANFVKTMYNVGGGQAGEGVIYKQIMDLIRTQQIAQSVQKDRMLPNVSRSLVSGMALGAGKAAGEDIFKSGFSL